jgi:hypothetical protein
LEYQEPLLDKLIEDSSEGVGEVRLFGCTGGEIGEGGTKRADDYTFFYGEGNGDHQSGTGFLVYKRIVSAVRRVEFLRYRM